MSWMKVTKKGYNVTVSRPPLGTVVHNVLEDANYVTDEKKAFVITGTRGEQWVITEDMLLRGYEVTAEQVAAIGSAGRICFTKVGTPVPVWASIVPVEQGEFQVPTAWGDVLTGNRAGIDHGWGDFIIAADDNGQPSDTDMWVVNGRVFFDTYQMLEEE